MNGEKNENERKEFFSVLGSQGSFVLLGSLFLMTE
jgi:hypothetical protein